MKIRWIIEEDGTKRLQVAYKHSHGSWDWEDVPEVPASEELDEDPIK